MQRWDVKTLCETLSMDMVYLSPSGRRCLLVPGRSLPWLEFRYLDEPALSGGGFYLRRHLFHRLMREAPQAMPLAGYLAAIRK